MAVRALNVVPLASEDHGHCDLPWKPIAGIEGKGIISTTPNLG